MPKAVGVGVAGAGEDGCAIMVDGAVIFGEGCRATSVAELADGQEIMVDVGEEVRLEGCGWELSMGSAGA